MSRPRCSECGEPLEFNEQTRTHDCFDCKQAEAVDTMLRDPERTPDVNEYDEEDKP